MIESDNGKIQREFIPGDEWLYFKFYTGPKTADQFLGRVIKPVVTELLGAGKIDRWFFIRYSDPHLHLRVRFHYTEPGNVSDIILAVHRLCRQYVDDNLLWKVQIDTYQREVERYGKRTMDLAEELFFHDSELITSVVELLEGDENERLRWLLGIRSVDAMLDDFQVDLENKLEFITRQRENFGREFGLNRFLKSQLEKKFRNDRSNIEAIVDRESQPEEGVKPFFDLIDKRSQALKPVAEKIIALTTGDETEKKTLELLPSYLHMMINRLFRSKQRLHELVVYDFLHRYYKSALARQKYGKMGKNQKQEKEQPSSEGK